MKEMEKMGKEPKTLGEVNELLQQAGIAPVTAECLEEMKSQVNRQQLVSAILRAPHDWRVKARLIGLINAGNRPWGEGEPSISKMLKERSAEAMPAAKLTPIRGARAPGDYLSVKAYGKKAALSFEADETRAGCFTVAVDGAGCLGERRYDWSNKLRVQLTLEELIQFTAVLYGIMPLVEFRNHGTDRNKGFVFERQADGYFGKVMRSGDDRVLYAVPVAEVATFQIAMLCLRQLRRNYPWTQGEDVVVALRRAFR